MIVRNNILLIVLSINSILPRVFCIDCFKCISINKDYPACEDPFHHNYTTDIFHSPCLGGRKGRDGLYPATSCIKINGIVEETGDTMILRSCGLDSGTLTTDTELVRMSHCGGFYYDNKYLRGCVQICDDSDACNSSVKVISNFLVILINIIPFLLVT